MIILGADYADYTDFLMNRCNSAAFNPRNPCNPRLIFITGLQIIIYALTRRTCLCTKLFFKRYWIKSYAKWRNKSMISLLNVKKGVSLQLNVRHDISCIYTCPLPMLVKCGNLMNHRTSVACISYWYGLTLPWFRVSTYLLTGIE